MINCQVCAINHYLTKYINEDTVKVVLSGGRHDVSRMDARMVSISGGVCWQLTKYQDNKALHTNYTREQFVDYLCEQVGAFRQINILNTDSTVNILISKKGKCSISTNSVGNGSVDTNHNRAKQYLINEGDDSAIMRELGIFTADNRIVASRRDKFKQINKFIEIIHHELKSYNKDNIVVTDFGCGKSYLTFLVYDYFSKLRNIDISVYGYDLKRDVVEHCSNLARKYNYSNLSFMTADIADQQKVNYKTDMMITLHACDTATDYALYNAIKGGVKYIFSVPCCQHEVNAVINNKSNILLNDGLIKERYSALVTDAIRCELLRQCGYSVDVIEFVDFSHSPKNLLIRAKLDGKVKRDFSSVETMLAECKCSQKLYELLTKED